jgi:hypothetical protein
MSDAQQTTTENTEKYFLIFKNKDGNVMIVSYTDLNMVYEVVTKYEMKEGTYRIIKGVQVV